MSEIRIRAVIFRRGDYWIAKCLEYGYVLQTSSPLKDVPEELGRALSLQVQHSQELGIEPFNGFEPAPRRYWEMYERAAPLHQVEVRLSG